MDIENIRTDTLEPSLVVERHYLQIIRGQLLVTRQKTPILGFIFPDTFRHIIDPAFMRQLPHLFADNRGVTNIFVKNRFGAFNISQRTKLAPTSKDHDIYFYYTNTYTPARQLDRIKILINVQHNSSPFYKLNCKKFIIPDWYLKVMPE